MEKRLKIYENINDSIKRISNNKMTKSEIADCIIEYHKKVLSLSLSDFDSTFRFNQSQDIIKSQKRYRDLLIQDLLNNENSVNAMDNYLLCSLELLSIRNALCVMPWEI